MERRQQQSGNDVAIGKVGNGAGVRRRPLDSFWGGSGGRESVSEPSLADNEWAALMDEEEDSLTLSSPLAGVNVPAGSAEPCQTKGKPEKGKAASGRRHPLADLNSPALILSAAALLVAAVSLLFAFLRSSSLQERIEKLERLTPVLETIAGQEGAMAKLRREIEAALASLPGAGNGAKQTDGSGGPAPNDRFAAGLEELRGRIDTIEARLAGGKTVQNDRGGDGEAGSDSAAASANKTVPTTSAKKRKPTRTQAPGAGIWSVNLGSFQERQPAADLAAKVKAAGFAAVIREVTVGGRKWHRVSIVVVASEEEANRINREVAAKIGIGNGWIHKN